MAARGTGERPLRKDALADALKLNPSAISRLVAGTRAFQEHEVAIISRFLGVEPPPVENEPDDYPERLTQASKLQRIADIAELGLAGSPEFRKEAVQEILGLARGE